mmetsp:Transcript_5762/g.11502  ORF Transcript_5762/g.11502 Transcript_5762/m.11502 type:complete len:313 (-) Transcript_5762:344-1282(-)|eukprot:scaffold145_cov173-Amphora_coffeaeformis.AAC.12
MPEQNRASASSRERNRIHARKTRQRKKEQMQCLQERAEELKQEQLCLKQIINEKNTASILVGLFATSANNAQQGDVVEDPRVEALLRRSVEDIPDATKIPELPALILPGQHASRKARAEAHTITSKEYEPTNSDGIDYELLGKDRSKCTPEELDRIRRERNRMHAKRTRDRKRMFMEEMGEMCRQLEEENDLLLEHIKTIDPDYDETKLPKRSQLVQPEGPAPLTPRMTSSRLILPSMATVSSDPSVAPRRFGPCNQLKTLLDAAGSFEKHDGKHISALSSLATSVSVASDSESSSLTSEVCPRPSKRVRSK